VTAIQQQNQGSADRSPRLEPLLDERQMAVILSTCVATIRRWRLQGRGARSIKIGAAFRYRQEHVQSWLDTRSSDGETKAEVVK